MPSGKPVASTLPAGVPELLTIEETAAIFRKTVRQLRWMVETGDAPPSAKIGGRIMFRLSDVTAFIEAKFDSQDDTTT